MGLEGLVPSYALGAKKSALQTIPLGHSFSVLSIPNGLALGSCGRFFAVRSGACARSHPKNCKEEPPETALQFKLDNRHQAKSLKLDEKRPGPLLRCREVLFTLLEQD